MNKIYLITPCDRGEKFGGETPLGFVALHVKGYVQNDERSDS